MTCPGLHCACCTGGAAVPVLPLAAFLGLAWIAEHLAEVAAVSAACGVLSVAAVVTLMRWQDRRQAARGPLMVDRAEVRAEVLDAAGIRQPRADCKLAIGTRVPDPGSAGRAAIAPIHLHFHGLPDDRQAAIIRQAIPGTAGDPDTRKE